MTHHRTLGTVVTLALTLAAATAVADEYLEFTQADVDKAIKAKDVGTLTNYCLHNANLDGAWKSACHAVLADYEAKGDAETLMRICNGNIKAWHTDYYQPACEVGTRLKAGAYKKALADCGKLKETWATYQQGLARADEDQLFFAVGLRAAECKAWDFVWTDLVHQGERGPALLGKLAAAGVAVDAELMTYLAANKDHPFDFEYGEFAAEHALTWMREAGKVGACARFVPYAKKASAATLSTWLAFFADTECRAALPLVLPRLKSKIAAQRRQACAIIGVLGGKKDIAKLKVLAKRDPEYKIERGNVKTYWVREACDAAIGQIELQ
ncbi:MAG: hypothetical protein IPL61_39500 [Myxococcales bacterium]|nr:hypothetical protein [Myxococcales bacterium]